jgi:hypothetical protein
MGIPKDLTREHVLQAIADLDGGMSVRWGNSRKYDLAYEGKYYSPKAILGLAICHYRKSTDQYAFDFSGGNETNEVLKALGFEIVSKNPYAES